MVVQKMQAVVQKMQVKPPSASNLTSQTEDQWAVDAGSGHNVSKGG
jgi:hypothetical protein